MRRTWSIAAIAVSCFFSALVCGSAFAKNQKETPKELIHNAQLITNLGLSGPFEMKADVSVLQPNGKMGKGTYTLDWAAPDRFREEIHIPGFDEIRVAKGKTLYRKRSIAAMHTGNPRPPFLSFLHHVTHGTQTYTRPRVREIHRNQS